MTGPLRALVYGDVDMNLIDGSAVWVQSAGQVLAGAGCDVTLLLKARVSTERLLEPLRALPTVRIVDPFSDGLDVGRSSTSLAHPAAVRVMTQLDEAASFDLVVLRGRRLTSAVVVGGRFDGRLWPYLTDIPQSLGELDADATAELDRIALASRFMLCQTEELRAFLESAVPSAAGRSVLFPPVVPSFEAHQETRTLADPASVRLVYAGKFAPRWNTLEMTELPGRLASRGITARIEMIGDKLHNDPADETYRERMEVALRDTPGVDWRGGLPREETLARTASADLALGWRDRRLDSSLELSTKLLEYGTAGLPVILNRTPMHEALLGVDYPFFAATLDDVVDTVELAARSPEIYGEASRRTAAAATAYSLDAAIARMRAHLDRAFPRSPAYVNRGRPLRIAVASRDLKFFTRIQDHLEALPNTEVRVDKWEGLSQHDVSTSRQLAEWADVVICEWCGPNAIWYSRHKRPGQRLIVRLHRFELYGHWPLQVDIDAVEQVVCVSPHYARLTREKTGWPASKVVVIPNWVDDAQLDRPKLAGARFHLGLIGMSPSRKRLDLAVEVVDRLRSRDPRFTLFVKSKLPWEYPWIWRRPEEQAYTDRVMRMIQGSDRLREGVVFDSFGPDVAAWLRRIGFVLSTSDDESFHLAPAEGMASGAVPAILNWPGAETIYDGRWIHPDPAAMADAIWRLVGGGRWDDERRIAQDQARRAFGLAGVLAAWERLLLEDLTPLVPAPAAAPQTPAPEESLTEEVLTG